MLRQCPCETEKSILFRRPIFKSAGSLKLSATKLQMCVSQTAIRTSREDAVTMLVSTISHAAGLLLTMASLVQAEPVQDVGASREAELLHSFKRRGQILRHMRESRKRSIWPRRSRSRRSEIGTQVTKNETFVLERTPPRLIHPSKFEYPEGNATHLAENKDYSVSSAPIVDSQDGEAFFRNGRTASSRGLRRPPNPLLEDDYGHRDPDVQEYRIRDFAAQRPQRGLSRESPILSGSFSNEGGVLHVIPARKMSRRDLERQHYFQAATKQSGDDSTKAVPTWQGQPSKFKPNQPYQPSLNSTTASSGYGDVISKSLWFYQVQSSSFCLFALMSIADGTCRKRVVGERTETYPVAQRLGSTRRLR